MISVIRTLHTRIHKRYTHVGRCVLRIWFASCTHTFLVCMSVISVACIVCVRGVLRVCVTLFMYMLCVYVCMIYVYMSMSLCI
ncbi:hypothetical protein F4775DRAFT_564611 [Biscogniauxia sp. FL1348]|nr:hypothetical protein F4775DRAFT_564611 [Biscogniauxia sp. FL1348]